MFNAIWTNFKSEMLTSVSQSCALGRFHGCSPTCPIDFDLLQVITPLFLLFVCKRRCDRRRTFSWKPFSL